MRMAVTICRRSLADRRPFRDDGDRKLVDRTLQRVDGAVVFKRCFGQIGIAMKECVDGLPQRLLRKPAHLSDHHIQRLQFPLVGLYGMLRQRRFPSMSAALDFCRQNFQARSHC